MIAFENQVTYSGGAFPNAAAQNATGPGNTDGTEWIKAVIDDMWGAAQELMNHAGMTPDGVTEAAGASQRREALQKIAGCPGEVLFWAGQDNSASGEPEDGFGWGEWDDPGTEGVRLLEMVGQGVLRASYPDLDSVTYCGDTANPTAEAFYHADDAAGTSRATDGVYLILPESRGMFIRGFDPASGYYDPYHTEIGSNREIGQSQIYAFQEHCHAVAHYTGGYGAIEITTHDEGTGTTFSHLEDTVNPVSNTDVWAVRQSETDTEPDGDCPDGTSLFYWSENETRPINLSFRMCIRY